MNLEERQKVYKAAIEKWGPKKQLGKMQEEAIELALAATRYIANDGERELIGLISEVADIENTIEVFEFMMHPNISFREQVDAVKKFKIERLVQQIEKDSK